VFSRRRPGFILSDRRSRDIARPPTSVFALSNARHVALFPDYENKPNAPYCAAPLSPQIRRPIGTGRFVYTY